MSGARDAKNSWAWFPYAAIGALGFVVLVNIGLIYAALRSNPGVAVSNDFGTSNRYDSVLDLAAKQAALGWNMEASVQQHSPALRLTGPDGSVLRHAVVTATALRPLGSLQATPLNFVLGDDGLYHTTSTLDAPGQWELRLIVTMGGESVTTTRRIVVK